MFRRKRHWAQALLFEEEDLTQEQGFFRKLNAYLAAPGVAGFAVLAYLFAIILIVRFVTVHWLQVLMIAPIAAARWQLYRMKKADRPDWQRYPKALAALDQGRAREAALALEELADRGYVRAQYTLAGLYATGRGVLKDPQRATHWLAQAAARGHAHALCELAARYLDGRGVPQDVQKALGRLSFRAPAQLSFRAQREILVLYPAIRLLPPRRPATRQRVRRAVVLPGRRERTPGAQRPAARPSAVPQAAGSRTRAGRGLRSGAPI